MSTDRISLLLIAHPDPDIAEKLRVVGFHETLADDFDVVVLEDDSRVEVVLADRVPHVILTFGDESSFAVLGRQPLDIRRRWVNLAGEPPAPGEIANIALRVFVDVATIDRFPDQPLVSIYTPTYETGERIERAFASLQAQTYSNWEWVLYDDSPGDETWERLQRLRERDARVRIFRSDRTCGNIGEVKRRCCGLARGSILVELDHDDELTPWCLADLLAGFAAVPEAGFAYTDCAEVFEDGRNASYGDTFAFGFGSYRTEYFRGRDWLVTNYPGLNAKTVRHIVGVPNHVRAWRREAYDAAGGYGSEIFVADDYELLLRTFLTTRILHIRTFGYIQYLGVSGENTQRRRNKEIQRLVYLFQQRYEAEIRDRLDELGSQDFIRDGAGVDWDREAPDDLVSAELRWPNG